MDAASLEAVLPGIARDLAGRRVTKVELAGKFAVLVRFADVRRGLWVSAHPELSRIGLVEAPPAAGAPRPAPDNLTEPLVGAKLGGVEQEPGGRVVRLRFERASGRHRSPVLVGELVPRFANVILTGDGERILWCRREFTGAGRPRQVAAGESYVPPAGGGVPPVGTGAGPAGIEIPPGADPAEAIDRWYREREEAEALEQLAAELRRTLIRRRKRAAKALAEIERRLEEAAREAEVRRHAELLAAHLPHVRRGMRSVRLPDFDGAGEVEIALDPKLDPRANLDALFRKARRLARGHEELASQRSVQSEELARVDAGLAALEAEPGPEGVRALVEELAPSLRDATGRAKGPAPAPAEKKDRAPSLPEGFNPRRYQLPGGWEVWVGRTAKQNDELTHRWAAPRDLWFHARGCEGSHTVLRIDSGKGEPPREIVEAAASIAAWHSKARRSGLVPVAYTEKRYVRRPRGAPAGTAAMLREKVLMVEPKLPGAGGD